MIIQGYLHSDISSTISLKLTRDGKAEKLLATAQLNPYAKKTIQKLLHRLFKYRHLTRGIPVSPLLQISNPGRGFHSGGTFPMKVSPSSQFETNRFGTPLGLSRIHAVDATVFPSIPATTITLSIMANAHRIGSEVELV